MLFLYIAAAVCVVFCAANVLFCVLALRAFRKWRGSALARFADLDAMIAAMPDVLLQESRNRLDPRLAFRSLEEAVCAAYMDGQRNTISVKHQIEEAVRKAEDARDAKEEASAQDKKDGIDITDDVMSIWKYSVADAFKAARGSDGGDGA